MKTSDDYCKNTQMTTEHEMDIKRLNVKGLRIFGDPIYLKYFIYTVLNLMMGESVKLEIYLHVFKYTYSISLPFTV